MNDELKPSIVRPPLKTSRAAAIAGILFSVLFILSLTLIKIAVPENPHETGEWLSRSWRTVALALNLLPFAGIAFLWFIGVLRDRIGAREDRLFATVFLGSGILLLAMLFACAAIAGGILMIHGVAPERLIDSNIYAFGRTVTHQIMKVYAMRMAGVFMILASSLALRTEILPRWMAMLGYVLALLLLLSLGRLQWIVMVFPLWVLLISAYILCKKDETQK